MHKSLFTIILYLIFPFFSYGNYQIDNTGKRSYNFDNIFSLSCPSYIELRDRESQLGTIIDSTINQTFKNLEELISKKTDIDLSTPLYRYVFQPSGINSNDFQISSASLKTYLRIIVSIYYEDDITEEDVHNLSSEDIQELGAYRYNSYQQLQSSLVGANLVKKHFRYYPAKRIQYGGKQALVYEYIRPASDESLTHVTQYLFYTNKKLLIEINISYKETDKNKYYQDISNMIKSIKFY